MMETEAARASILEPMAADAAPHQERIALTRVRVLINRKAGRDLVEAPETLAEEIERVFARRGVAAKVAVLAPEEVVQAAREVAAAAERGAAPVDAVIVCGGDGSVTAVARALDGTDLPIGVIPLGTMNLVAGDLGMPEAPVAAAEALAEGALRRIDVGRINGRLFLCNTIMGLFPLIAHHREKGRGLPVLRRLLDLARASWRVVRISPLLRLEIATAEGTRTVRTRALAVTNNLHHAAAGARPGPRTLQDGCLALHISRHRSRFGFVVLAAEYLCGTWPHDRHLEIERVRGLTVRWSRHKTLAISVDGDVERAEAPLTLEIDSQAVPMLAPSRERSGASATRVDE